MNNKVKLIECSAIQMSQHGYIDVSLDALIELTGISKSNLYYYYSSKEKLGLDVLKFWIAAFVKLDDITLLNSTLPTQKQFNVYCDRLIAFQKANQFCGNPCWSLENEIKTEEAHSYYTNYILKHIQNLQLYIVAGQKAGVIIKKLDADGSADLINLTMLGAEMACRTEKSVAPLARSAKLISHLLF